MSYLSPLQPAVQSATIRRFEPAYWDINFNPECAATYVTTGADSFNVSALFRSTHDFVGVYWRSVDLFDHPMFAYAPNFDYTGLTLTFNLAYSGAPGLSDANGMTLTVTDTGGNVYYLRLNNFKTSGTDFAATISIDFSTAMAGYAADIAVPWSRIESMFLGLAPEGYDIGAALAPITETAASLTVSGLTLSGSGTTLPINALSLTPHELGIADGYGDSYNLAPERLINQMVALGYHTALNLYLGFDLWNSLSWSSGLGAFQIDTAKPVLNAPTGQWLSDYFTRAAGAGFAVTLSMSLELLESIMPLGWAQADYAGRTGISGWVPPSAFVAPTNATAMTYLANAAIAAVGLGLTAGATMRFQVGEPWWWDGSFGNTGPCFYDATTQAAYTAETGLAVPTPFLETTGDDYSAPEQVAYLGWLQGKLGAATLAWRDGVQAAHPGVEALLLIYTPQVLNSLTPMMTLANFAQTQWASPAWGAIEIEDYDTVIAANWPGNAAAMNVPAQNLGYALAGSHYFSGYVASANQVTQWQAVDRAIWQAFQAGYGTVFVWARPQVFRDGWVYDHSGWAGYAAVIGAGSYPAFPTLPKAGFPIIRTPVFSTLVARHVSGRELRSPQAAWPTWQYEITFPYLPDAAGAAWFQALKGFFEQMQGPYAPFLFVDPLYNSATAQPLGVGDGYATGFALTRSLGGYVEPVSVVTALAAVYVAGEVQSPAAYQLSYESGYPVIEFLVAPASGAAVTADYSYAFLCRFSGKNLNLSEMMSGIHSLKSLKFQTVKP